MLGCFGIKGTCQTTKKLRSFRDSCVISVLVDSVSPATKKKKRRSNTKVGNEKVKRVKHSEQENEK